MDERYDFDLELLLKSGEVDVRGVAANSLSLTLNGYFKILTKLIDNMATTVEALERTAGFNNSKEDIIIFDYMNSLLEQAGCKGYAAEMTGMIEVITKGNKGLSATRANGMLKEFPHLQERLCATVKKKPGGSIQQMSYLEVLPAMGDAQPNDRTTLKEALEQIEYADAVRKPRILAVDDAAVVLRTVYGVLSADYTVYMLSKPTMLEKVLEHVVPELFLLDYKMPELSGFDLVPIIRNIPEHKDTPIIFLTAMGTIDHISTAMLLGACDFMVKPFQPDRLREKVAKHIVRKKL